MIPVLFLSMPFYHTARNPNSLLYNVRGNLGIYIYKNCLPAMLGYYYFFFFVDDSLNPIGGLGSSDVGVNSSFSAAKMVSISPLFCIICFSICSSFSKISL